MYVFGSGRCRRRGGEWMRGLDLGFTNPVGTGGVLDVCLCCGGAGGERVEGLNQGLEAWCCVCVIPEYLCRWQVQVFVLCLADTCASEVHPVFNPVAHYRYVSYRVFIYGRYRKSRLVCVWLSDPDLSPHGRLSPKRFQLNLYIRL